GHWREPTYPLPPERVFNLARRLLCHWRPTRPSDKPFSAADLVRMAEKRLQEYHLPDWRVMVRAGISSTNTDSANRVLNIRADSAFSLEDMKRLIVHEIDTHVLRAANGFCQPFRIFAVGAVPNYVNTEEGLAVINEERMGYIDMNRSRTFAARLIAAVSA